MQLTKENITSLMALSLGSPRMLTIAMVLFMLQWVLIHEEDIVIQFISLTREKMENNVISRKIK